MNQQLFTVPPKLTDRQQFVFAMTDRGQPFADGIRAEEAGRELHVHQRKPCGCGPFRSCEYAHSSGVEVLRALYRRGLLRRDRRHVYRRVESSAGGPGDLPEGF